MNKKDNSGDVIRRRWRRATRRCTIATCHSHKGGQGRTLTCAHLALELAGRHNEETAGRRAAPNILLVDLDWEAPGLSYMFSSDALPEQYTIETDEISRKSVWSSIELLTAMANTLKQDASLRKLISANGGIPRSEQEHKEIMQAIERQINGLGEAEKRPLALQIRTPTLTASASNGKGRIYLLPATPIADTNAAFMAMRFDVGAFISGLQEKTQPKVNGEAILRLTTLFLIQQFDLDYLLIDCRPGVTPLGYMASTRLSDIALIPTTTYTQALHGARTLVKLLNPPADQRASAGPFYGPEKVVLFYSNISETGWTVDSEDHVRLSDSLAAWIKTTLGIDDYNKTRPSEIILPHVGKLEVREGFVSFDSKDTAERFYVKGIRQLTRCIDKVFDAKVEGQFSLAPFEAMFSTHALDSLLDAGDLTISVLVEEGGFGEQPFRELVKHFKAVANLDGRLHIDPLPITHDELLTLVRGKKNFADLKDAENIGKVPDLVSFPHYMLGKLAQDRWILPLTFLDTLEDTPPIDFRYLHDHFYLADELCLHAGTPFAFPFSILRKLLLVKKGFEGKFGLRYEKEFGEPLDLKRAGLRIIQRSLEIARDVQAQAPLIVENNFDLVGVWYDWLEFVFSFGGTDFTRREDRGSDYGECRLNNLATIDGTFAYLNLFWSNVARSDDHQTWYTSLDNFLNDPNAWMTIAWSDIVTSKWTEVSSQCLCLPFPSALPTPQEAIIEGWVTGIPYVLKEDNQRLKAIKRFLLWFLSEPIQTEFARVGGSPSRRLAAEQLPAVLRLVHSALTTPKDTRTLGPKVAPKITFPEAPDVIHVIRKTLKEMVGWSPNHQNKQAVAHKMDQLARKVAITTLDGKSLYVPLA